LLSGVATILQSQHFTATGTDAMFGPVTFNQFEGDLISQP
jgi:hypothetical protein